MFIISFILVLLMIPPLSALDFTILNKGEIVFQEIFVQTEEGEEDYFHNFGLNGLEPGARHGIHINCDKDLLFCSFYLKGIKQEHYEIENVAIEEGSLVYILPEHYKEKIDEYNDLENPSVVYGAQRVDALSGPSLYSEEPYEASLRRDLEIFNYTNFPIFRLYFKASNKQESDSQKSQDYLKGVVLMPQESRTFSFYVEPERGYTLSLINAEGRSFEKKIDSTLKEDFLVFYDSDEFLDFKPIPLTFENQFDQTIEALYLIDQKSFVRIDVLKGEKIPPSDHFDYLLEKKIDLFDIVCKFEEGQRIYLLDKNLPQDKKILVLKNEEENKE